MNYLGGTMKYNFDIKEVNKDVALDMIQRYHYSNTLPPYKSDFSKDFNKDDLIAMIKKAGGEL